MVEPHVWGLVIMWQIAAMWHQITHPSNICEKFQTQSPKDVFWHMNQTHRRVCALFCEKANEPVAVTKQQLDFLFHSSLLVTEDIDFLFLSSLFVTEDIWISCNNLEWLQHDQALLWPRSHDNWLLQYIMDGLASITNSHSWLSGLQGT